MIAALLSCRLTATAMLGPLAYWPMRDPIPVDRFWLLLLLPLVLAISVVYKTIKIDDLSKLPRQAATLAVQIVAFMILAAAVLWLITEMV